MRSRGFLIVLALLGFTSARAENSAVNVKVQLSPAGSFTAETQKVTGEAYKTPTGVSAENISVDLNSLSSGIGLRDKHMKDRLLVTKFPTAKLVKAVGKDGKGTATIEIKGLQKEVAGTYKIVGNTLDADFPIHLSDFDIKDIRYMSVGVKDDVVVNIKVPIKSAPARKAASMNPGN